MLSNPTQVAPLAAEIFDEIIDHLHADEDTLQACSLTCKSWAPSARYHLFSEVTLSSKTLIARFTKLLRGSISNQSTSSIAQYVRRLVLQFKRVDPSSFRDAHAQDLIYICSHLHSVTSLGLHNIDMRFPVIERLSSLISPLSNVVELDILRTSSEAMEELLEVVYSFPSLRWLSMVNHGWLKSPGPNSLQFFQRGPSFRIRDIGLAMWKSDETVDWLLARNPVPTIEILHCYTHSENGGKGTQRLIAAVGSSVSALDINIVHAIGENGRLIDFTDCPNVRIVRILNIHLLPRSTREHKTWVPQSLLKMSSVKIEEISLYTYTGRHSTANECLDSIDWNGLVDTLMQPQFANLRRLTIYWDVYSAGVPQAKAMVKEKSLFTLQNRGLLFFEDYERELSALLMNEQGIDDMLEDSN